MRLIKLSKKEFPTPDDLHRYFLGLTPELRERGFLFPGVHPKIGASGLEPGEWILFSYDTVVRYVARAASGRQRYEGPKSEKYSYRFLVNPDSLRPAMLPVGELQRWLEERVGPGNHTRGEGWNKLSNELAPELLPLISESLPRVDAVGVEEGIQEERTEAFRQRNGTIVKERLRLDDYTCQVCGFHLIANGHPVIECHHLLSLSEGTRTTRISELASLCPTCHRIAHTRRPSYTLSEIKQIRILSQSHESAFRETVAPAPAG